MIDRLRKLMLLFGPSDWLRFGFIVLMMLGAAVLELIGLGAIPAFVAVVGRPDLIERYPAASRLMQRLGIDSSIDTLIAGSLILIVLFGVRTLYLVISYYIQDRIVRNRQIELSHRLFEAYLSAPFAYHLTRNSAELLRNSTQETERLAAEVLTPLLVVIRQTIVILAVVGLVIWREPLIGMLAFPCLALAGGGFLAMVNNRMKHHGTEEQSARGRQYQTVSETASLLKEIRILCRERRFLRRFHDNVERMARAQQYRDTVRRSTWPTMEFIVVTGLLCIAMAMVSTGRSLDELMPTLALFTVALARLKGCATELVSSLTQVRYQMVAIDAVYNDLEHQEQRIPESTLSWQKPVTPVQNFEEIQVDSVSFRYGEELPDVIKEVSLRIRHGESVAFIGPTGGGKSTLVDIIVGLLEPRVGSVKVDGREIRSNLRSWMASIGYIPQTITLVDDTVAANIALGLSKDEVDQKALQEAIRTAQLEDTIAALPQGIDTVVGERGARLSGGQRQRIGIARALYHRPSLLIMDEGTSALDTATEQALVRAVNALRGEGTIIMIAHRLTTVEDCDRLFRIEDGCLTATGSYLELAGGAQGRSEHEPGEQK